jgi:hypothetical protein
VSGQFKTRKPTPGGRLVNQAQLHVALQGAADKIVAHVANAFVRLEQHTEARLARIEKELGLSEMPVGPVLVKDEELVKPEPVA